MTAKPHPPLMKKHSQTDLVSRLKTRKILGVGGEDDDGEVHRSKDRPSTYYRNWYEYDQYPGTDSAGSFYLYEDYREGYEDYGTTGECNDASLSSEEDTPPPKANSPRAHVPTLKPRRGKKAAAPVPAQKIGKTAGALPKTPVPKPEQLPPKPAKDNSAPASQTPTQPTSGGQAGAPSSFPGLIQNSLSNYVHVPVPVTVPVSVTLKMSDTLCVCVCTCQYVRPCVCCRPRPCLPTLCLARAGPCRDAQSDRLISQMLGNEIKFAMREPVGLRIWILFSAVVFTLMALMALAFPNQMYEVVFDQEQTAMSISIRLYGGALLSLSVIMWNGLYTAEKVIIQWTLLSEACYFAIQFI
ncbi:hypothetical protein P4O66_018491, partial [Electrophorus voltai]